MLRISAKGLLLVAFMWLAMLACANCSPKIGPVLPLPITEADIRMYEENKRAREQAKERENRPVSKPPAGGVDARPVDPGISVTSDDFPSGGYEDVGSGVDDDVLGDVNVQYGDDDETPVTPAASGRAQRPSAAQDFDPFAGSGEEGEEEPVAKPALNADDYKVALDVTNEITLNSNATLRVWIGLENYLPKPIPTTARDTTTIPASLGDYARITPYAPDFTVGPEESQVMRIVPSGSSVLFSLTPEREGEFLISAKIELYDNPDLVGVAVPKTSDIVSVVVKVDTKAAVKSHLGQLGDVAWSEFLKFWGAIVALLLGALYFIINKHVKKKTGYAGDKSKAYGGGASAADEPETFDPGSTPDPAESEGDIPDDPFATEEPGETGEREDPFA